MRDCVVGMALANKGGMIEQLKNERKEKIKQAMRTLKQAQAILDSINWTAKEIENDFIGKQLFTVECAIDTAHGATSYLSDLI